MTAPIVHMAWSAQDTLSAVVKAVLQIEQDSQIIQYGDRPIFNFRDLKPNVREIILSNQPGIKPVTFMGKYIPSVQISPAHFPTCTLDISNGILPNSDPNAYDGMRTVIKEALSTSELFIKLRSNQTKLADLNARERTVVMLAAEGVPNKTIARRLNVSVKTIEHCRRKAYSKLDVTCSAEVASLVTFDRFFAALSCHSAAMS